MILKSEDKSASVTGNFDPLPLERAAKALRSLDTSPNASKAFELSRLQEVTKQKQLEKDATQLSLQKSKADVERTKADGEERRRTLRAQQEEERITAQYRLQLENEAKALQLEEQKRHDTKLLAEKHKYCTVQEEMRKQNELEILEKKKIQSTIEFQSQLNLQESKIKTETDGRIRQERENVDVHLKQIRESAALKADANLKMLNLSFERLGSGIKAIFDDRRKRSAFIALVTGAALGIYGSKASTRVASAYIEARLGRPPLIRESSRRLFSPLSVARTLKTLAFRGSKGFTERVVLPPDLSERLEWTSNALMTSRISASPLRNLLLHGRPGTGKTLFARTLARESGLHYAIMSGGDVGPLGKDAVTEIRRVFRWAEKTRKGMILFIDEADAFLRMGRKSTEHGLHGNVSEHQRNAISTFLHLTGSESCKICIILATNGPEALDKAVLDRMDDCFEFPLPPEEERFRMLQMFFKEFLSPLRRYNARDITRQLLGFLPLFKARRQLIVDPAIDESFLRSVAERTQGFSGRQLAKLIVSMRAVLYGSGVGVLTRDLAESVVQWKLSQFSSETGAS